MIISPMINNFRSHIVDSPTAGLCGCFDNLCKAEVSNFASIGAILAFLEEYVLTFQIPVNDVSLVDGLYTHHHLMQDLECFWQWKYPLWQLGLILK